MKSFFGFIREQGVVGLAVGFVVGSSISKLVTAFITDIVDPLLGFALGWVKGLSTAYIPLGESHILYGDLLSVLIDFLLVAFVIFIGVEVIGLGRLDKKKE